LKRPKLFFFETSVCAETLMNISIYGAEGAETLTNIYGAEGAETLTNIYNQKYMNFLL
jgi:hypothetical protein